MRYVLSALVMLAHAAFAPAQGPSVGEAGAWDDDGPVAQIAGCNGGWMYAGKPSNEPVLKLTATGKTKTECSCATGGDCRCGPNCTCDQPIVFLEEKKGGATGPVRVKPGEVPDGFTDPVPGTTGTHLLYPDGTLVPIAPGHIAGKTDSVAAKKACSEYTVQFGSCTGGACGLNGSSVTVVNGQTYRFGPSVSFGTTGGCGAGGCSSCGQAATGFRGRR